MRRTALAALLVVALGSGCAHQPRPGVAPSPAPKRGVRALQTDLASYYRVPAFANAVWGVLVTSLKTGDVLYAQNPRTFLMPASNMKVITMAAAAERLGWDYTFQTRVVATGPVENGVLKGDIVVVGSGDPSLGGRPGETAEVFDGWADEIRAKGITAIEGRVIGDDNAFDDDGLGAGWAWDYLADGYATPVSGLEFNENVVQVIVKPGASVGDPATAEARPDASGLLVECVAKTVARDGETDLNLARLPGSRVLRVSGTVALGRTDVTRTASVDNPTAFMVAALRRALTAKGVVVSGDAIDVDTLPAAPDVANAQTLVVHTSPTLAQIGKVLLKASQNLYAETFLRALGRPATGQGPATSAAGIKAVQDTLKSWGIPPDRYLQVDGSGLSRYNYLTADVLVSVLTRMYTDTRHRAAFSDGLPLAGVDGSIAGRMKNTKAQGNARAKTGSISNARALSGYVTSADGEPLVFSMIVNNFNVPQSDADAIIDRAVVRLAEFRR
ncbi:MAG: D-alanyl-D-alanine carboxypeptidase/D-alanyl-D-alanine-endopeptidase [Acidobacteria bacterium]|nr:D-alanyl-D-alanine carboxypeptidase/D-alanyl-D-alanine-endopeptidase [Acidobacteriota bacterium]